MVRFAVVINVIFHLYKNAAHCLIKQSICAVQCTVVEQICSPLMCGFYGTRQINNTGFGWGKPDNGSAQE